MSGYLPGAGSFRLTGGLENTPILHLHGQADPVVRVCIYISLLWS